MFGKSSDDNTIQDVNSAGADDNGAPSLPTMGGQDSPFTVAPSPPADDTTTPTPPPADDNVSQPAAEPVEPPQAEEEPLLPEHGTPDQMQPADDAMPANPDTIGGASGDLVDIKQQALQQLSPLVSHLDQTPEEKFRTTMMMIQATDDQSLLKSAYDSAQQITDDKERAQALLDVINEINYFTQQHNA